MKIIASANHSAISRRSYECDEIQDEDLIGPDPRPLQGEELFLEAMVKRAIEDCGLTLWRGSSQTRINPIVRDAWLWLMDAFDEDWNAPFTFAWCCENLGYHQEGIRRLVQQRFGHIGNLIEVSRLEHR